MDEHRKRIHTGFWIALIVYGILFLSRWTWVLNTAAALLGMAATYEILLSAGMDRKKPLLWICILGAGCLAVFPMQHVHAVLCVATPVVFAFFIWVMSHLERFHHLKSWHHVAFAAGLVLLIRAIPELGGMKDGMFYLLMAVTSCFLTDVFAYHVGKRYGRHKLAPIVSPNKTTEGAVGGIVLTIIAMFLLKPLIVLLSGSTCPNLTYGLYILLLTVAAQIGDLSMSALKRVDGVKDFGAFLPGHGGMLDRFDSHIFGIALLTVLLMA